MDTNLQEPTGGAISDDTLLHRMFDLGEGGQRDSGEYAMLDALMTTRLLQTYDDGTLGAASDALI